MKLIALIPARSGSQRIPNKNIKMLRGYPLIAYTIAQAKVANIFSDVFVSTDCENIAEIAKSFDAKIILRPSSFAKATSPDIQWVLHAFDVLQQNQIEFNCFSILRPTSPFRRPTSIVEAWEYFKILPGVDSLRAVEKVKQHPGKMWVIQN